MNCADAQKMSLPFVFLAVAMTPVMIALLFSACWLESYRRSAERGR